MPTKVTTHYLPPTPLIPNSPLPLLHYPRLLTPLIRTPSFSSTAIFDLFARNGWQTQWIARYGADIQSHYHSTTHEAMVVIAGSGATIRFGVADRAGWVASSVAGARGDGEQGGVEIHAQLGDVFVIPAGVSHKAFSPLPDTGAELAFYQPDDVAAGRAGDVSAEREREHREFFGGVEIREEFMMMGAYPYGGVWDFAVGGEHGGREEVVWNVGVPERDPVLGGSGEGLCGLWRRGGGVVSCEMGGAGDKMVYS